MLPPVAFYITEAKTLCNVGSDGWPQINSFRTRQQLLLGIPYQVLGFNIHSR